MTFNSLKDIYSKIKESPLGQKVIFNEFDGIIELYKDNYSVKATYNMATGGMSNLIEYDNLEFNYELRLRGSDALAAEYEFLMGILEGKVNPSIQNKTFIRLDGWAEKKPKRISPAVRILDGLIGLGALGFGAIMLISFFFFIGDYDHQEAMELLATIPVYLAAVARGGASIKKAIVGAKDKKRLWVFNLGAMIVFFAITLITVEWADYDSGSDKTDEIGLIVVAILFIMIGIALIALSYYKGKIDPILIRRTPKLPDYHDLEQIYERIADRTRQEVNAVSLDLYKRPTVFNSKIGGDFYWDMSKPYPVDSQGKPMVCVAQFNLEELPPINELPSYGMLQIFLPIGVNENIYTGSTEHRIIYHNYIDRSFTPKALAFLGMDVWSETELLHILGETAISVSKKTIYRSLDIPMNDIMFEVAAELGIELDDTLTYGELALGYKAFKGISDEEDVTPGSPRIGVLADTGIYPKKSYDTLLLSLDSFDIGEYIRAYGMVVDDPERDIEWIESGTANFYIHRDKLKALDMSDTYFDVDIHY